MRISEIIQLTDAVCVCGNVHTDAEVVRAFSSDLMSDVLTLDSDDILLITGLANPQSVRTAEMADIHFVLLTRNKKATEEMIRLANENHITILETAYSLFKSSGILYKAGLKPVY
jgi:predicted transcriptional regulator